MAPENRFWRHVARTGNVCECWLWTGKVTRDGYGQFAVGSLLDNTRGKISTHRFAYAATFGEIPSGLYVDHLCSERLCVNPWHLEPVTPAENARRCGRYIVRRTECPRGHALTPDNTRDYKGKRFCRACDRCRPRRPRRPVHLPT